MSNDVHMWAICKMAKINVCNYVLSNYIIMQHIQILAIKSIGAD